MILISVIVIAVCCLILYSLCAISAEADRKAEEMYKNAMCKKGQNVCNHDCRNCAWGRWRFKGEER